MNVSINALDNTGSLLWANNNGTPQSFAYSPFGSTPSRSGDAGLLPGFNGERLDPVSQTYHLGNGYRTYNPVLMRFNAPDSWSPFGSGGLNQYAYCEGDPINRSDPSGHISSGAIGGIFGAILGIVGAMLAVYTFGASIGAIAALETASAITAGMAAETLASGLGVAAAGTGIASAATAKSDPGLSQTLGWVSLGLGIASFATGAVDAIHAKVTGRSASFDLSRDGGRDVTNSTHVLVGEMNNTKRLGDGLVVFDDPHNGGTRFNMSMHGHTIPGESYSGVILNGKSIGESELKEFIEGSGIDFGKYDSARLIVCHSANGGEESFAQRFSNMIEIPVEAYEGKVGTGISPSIFKIFPESIQNKLWEHVMPIGGSRIHVKNRPFLPISDFEYNPRFFKPSFHATVEVLE